jgi:hypothetical protein
VAKFLINEKKKLLNTLNCTNDNNFVIHVFKNFDEKHNYISIPKYDEFNKTKIENWVSSSIELSVKNLNLNSIKSIYENDKPAFIYIDRSFDNKNYNYFNNEKIQEENDNPNNEIFNIMYKKSLKKRNNFIFLKAIQSDFSTKLIMDLFELKQINSPLILGLYYDKENRNFIRNLFTKNNDVKIIENSINNYIKEFNKKNKTKKNNYILEDNYTFENSINNPFYKSENHDILKFEINKIDKSNFNKEVNQRENHVIYILFTYKGNLKIEVNIF